MIATNLYYLKQHCHPTQPKHKTSLRLTRLGVHEQNSCAWCRFWVFSEPYWGLNTIESSGGVVRSLLSCYHLKVGELGILEGCASSFTMVEAAGLLNSSTMKVDDLLG